MKFRNMHTLYTKNNEPIKHPFVLDTLAYYEIMRELNQEQQSIIKQIVLWRKNNPRKRFCLFITGGASIEKTFVALELYHALLRLYIYNLQSGPLKKKDRIVTFTGKVAYVANVVTIHLAYHLLLSPCDMNPLISKTVGRNPT